MALSVNSPGRQLLRKQYGINWTWKHGARFYLVVLPSLWSTLSLAVGIVAKHAWLA